MLELYNTTKEVKSIPKYRYNGTYTIMPYKSVDIEEEQAYFFKPYSRIGVVVRCKANRGTEPSVVVEEVASEPEVADEVSETVFEAPDEEVVEDTVEEVSQTVFTEEDFVDKSLSELKDMAESIGLDASDCRRKNQVIELIKNSQK